MFSMSRQTPLPSMPEVGSPHYQVLHDEVVAERTLQYAAGGLLLGMIIGPEGTSDMLSIIGRGIESPDVLSVLGKIRDSVGKAVTIAEIRDGRVAEYAQNFITRIPVSGVPVATIGALIGYLVGKATRLK